jgi:peroxiredoxin
LFTRRKDIAVPEVGADAPEFNLPSAQGGQLRLSMRTARGPVVVVFFRGPWSEEDVAYFKALSEKEDEINHAAASIVGIGLLEPDEAREFVRASGIKSHVLYDYVRVTTRQWGLLEKDREHGEYARPAIFIVGSDHKIVHAWTGERPAGDGERPRKMSAEERERTKTERRAAREAGKSLKKSAPVGKEGPENGGKPESRTENEAEKPERGEIPEKGTEPGEQSEARAWSEKPGERSSEEE